MTTAGRRGILAVVVAVALLAIGVGLAVLLSTAASTSRATGSSTALAAAVPENGGIGIRHVTVEHRDMAAWLDILSSADIAGTGFDPAGDSHSGAVVVAERAQGLAHTAPAPIAERDLVMAWFARVLLALALAWVVIGILSARTRLVRRPGAAAARATWLASTRPWRARESTLGMLALDRWLLFIIPVALLVATRAVQTSFFGGVHLAVVIGAWTLFALVLRLVVGRRSPWPVIAAVGGVVILRCIVTLIGLSFAGPGGSWSVFWTSPTLRALYIAFAFALFVWAFVAAGWALSVQLGKRRATGGVLAAIGAGLTVPALIIALVGVRHALTVWNAQLEPLPWSLARFLQIPGPMTVSDAAAWWLVAVGVIVTVVGAVLARPSRDRVAAL